MNPAKAKALDDEGVTAYMLSGSYRVPTNTLTGSVMKDLMLIDKVIGVGEIALSDHRSSQPDRKELLRLSADARVGGILSGKSGVLNIHLGEGARGLSMLRDILEQTEIPATQFLPTHINRDERLFNEGLAYALKGGFIDFTTSSDPVYWEEGEVKASTGLKRCLDAGVAISQITFTSDGQGSMPIFDEHKQFLRLGIGQVTSLFTEVRDAVLHDGVPLQEALKVITTNPADLYKLKDKGQIALHKDADVVLLDRQTLEVQTVVAKGQVMMRNRELLRKGTFE